MKESLISLKTAKLTKEKGIKIIVENCYDPKCLEPNHIFNWWEEIYCSTPERIQRLIPAPSQSLLQKYLREIHHINVFVLPNRYDSNQWYYVVGNLSISKEETNFTYEEALEEGLYNGLLLIKK